MDLFVLVGICWLSSVFKTKLVVVLKWLLFFIFFSFFCFLPSQVSHVCGVVALKRHIVADVSLKPCLWCGCTESSISLPNRSSEAQFDTPNSVKFFLVFFLFSCSTVKNVTTVFFFFYPFVSKDNNSRGRIWQNL